MLVLMANPKEKVRVERGEVFGGRKGPEATQNPGQRALLGDLEESMGVVLKVLVLRCLSFLRIQQW